MRIHGSNSPEIEHCRQASQLFWSFTCLLASAALIAVGCHSGSKLPDKSSQAYADFVSAFYVGLAALQVGDDVRAEREHARATQIVPGEPAAWSNWGVLALRQRNFDPAEQRLERARALAPKNDAIYYLLGLVESGRGNSVDAIAHFSKAVEINPNNLIATYRLAEEIERQGDVNSDIQFQKLMQRIVDAQPDNVAALLELSRVAAKRGDAAALKQSVARIQAQSKAWPAEVQEQLTALEAAAAGPDPHAAAMRTNFLRNVLMRVPDFRQSLAAIKPPPGDEAQPFTHFLLLESPVFSPAPADVAMTFDVEPPVNSDKTEDQTQWNWIGAISLSGTGPAIVAKANGSMVQLATGAKFPFPGGASKTPPLPEGIVPTDFNYDFKTDLVLAGAGGVRFFRQDKSDTFTDVTEQTKLPASVVNGHYTGGWAVDIEADGDLDIVLGSRDGVPTVLRNNGDNTFTPIHPFTGVSGVREFVWADLNGDGNPDAAFIDGSGKLHVFSNQRSGRFSEMPAPPVLGQVKAITAADASHNGILDLLALQANGAILRLAVNSDGQSWERGEVASVPDAANFLAGDVRLRAADLDNNGAIDLLLGRVTPPADGKSSGALVWLGDDKGTFVATGNAVGPAMVFDAADLNADGRLDLLGLSADGQAMLAANRGTKNYHWQIIRPRAKQATGDQRINSFGVGGEIEIRSGLLVQMQPITGPQMHFGLGRQTGVDVARILWPNGSVRAEFALKADQEVVTEQRLKGSCPFLFAYNGKDMKFVKDAIPWGSAIGLRINSLGTASIGATEEWYKIGHDELAPHDGYYDLRITGELWETYYYDYLTLMAVDHPAGTEIFTDERFAVPAIKPKVIAVATPHKIVRAIDDNGQDVTNIVRDLDNRYLDTFGRGQYQGVTRDHYVEVDLGDAAPVKGPLYLIAKGWLHPSDSSINVAISQGQHEQARALSLEVSDGHGGWVVAEPNLGFPAGRKKICLFDLTNVFRPGTSHKVRLRTNLEIYWDSIEWAQGQPEANLKITRLAPSMADLHYRGYSVIHQANDSSPEIPNYNHLSGTKQPWRDLEGYYTRYGDVRALLRGVDDRYVIMNAGDEISLRFPALPEPPGGWVRDYVIAGDGWIKDGDYNSTYSRTVLPLPHHDRKQYDTPPGRLEEEWVYRHHPEDWQTYQTRYITPEVFKNALRSKADR
ncbi:MAG TPA: FG-GAP-like repeat-containing protein [Silvibacterium sp.]|nr:FG-GAP-like repeat-containing protein [Silvibacterium sp.]